LFDTPERHGLQRRPLGRRNHRLSAASSPHTLCRALSKLDVEPQQCSHCKIQMDPPPPPQTNLFDTEKRETCFSIKFGFFCSPRRHLYLLCLCFHVRLCGNNLDVLFGLSYFGFFCSTFSHNRYAEDLPKRRAIFLEIEDFFL
jgi:hypothetical protein